MDMYSKVLLSLFLVNGLLVIAGSLKAAIEGKHLESEKRHADIVLDDDNKL